MQYSAGEIEKKWQKKWEDEDVYKSSIDTGLPKFYVLDMFPYPSGEGLHVGHPLGYVASDIYSRYKKMQGFNILHPIGFDAFGLPAEQYAVQKGIHPRKSTEQNIERYRKQLKSLGLSYDWSREVNTADPDYYKFTQWLFIMLFHHYYDLDKDRAIPIDVLIQKFNASGSRNVRAVSSNAAQFSKDEWKEMSRKEKSEILMNYRLAYKRPAKVNWCEELGTVLANDEVQNGVSERGGYPVEQKELEQWTIRITAYADRLLKSLKTLEWTESLKTMQKNWIGKSDGAEIYFPLQGLSKNLAVFTTRPDTIFGCTFMVLAPEHPVVDELIQPDKEKEFEKFRSEICGQSDVERSSAHEVHGFFTGSYAIHPITKEKLPVWVSNYILMEYGSGAIMAVPSDDDRDYRFAKKYGLEIKEIKDGGDMGDREGILKNSDFLDGMNVDKAISEINKYFVDHGIGRRRVYYKLRDANFSRQRYWGEPIPIIYDEDDVAHALMIDELPLTLPSLEDFKPTKDAKSPLAKAENWVHLKNNYTRDTDTMPGYAGSSWYFLRFMDPHNEEQLASPEAINYWKDVDLYVGGTEHAVGHLMYARFFQKFLYDMGYVMVDEPFRKLVNQGKIQGIIEFLYMKKDRNSAEFYSAEMIDESKEENYIKVPVPVKFVSDYNTDHSHLDVQGLKEFIEWSPEFSDAIFHQKDSTWSPGSSDKEFKVYTKSELGKMSKSKHNVINPDEVIEKYGADCFRMYEMFLGPIEQDKPWDTQGIDGVDKFLKKYWSLFFKKGELKVTKGEPSREELHILHTAIKSISEDIEDFSLNTCISQFMITVNKLRKIKCNKRAILEPLNFMLAPFAPHLAEEIHHHLDLEPNFVIDAKWPVLEEKYLEKDENTWPVCINGKKKTVIKLDKDLEEEEVILAAKDEEIIEKNLKNKKIKRVVVVPGRMINFVV